MDCPVCENPETRPCYRMTDRFFGTTTEEFTLNRCPSCGLLFLEESAVEKQLGTFYPPGYWWSEQGPSGKLERRYREWMVSSDQLRFLSGVLQPLGGLRLLDIGCGSGTFVRLARRAGVEAMGLELSREAAAIAEREAPGAVMEGSEEEILEQGRVYDVVTLFHSLEHMTTPFRFLKKLRRILKEEGSLIVQVPNAGSLQARVFGSRWYGLDCPRHLYNYTSLALLHLLGRAGYRIRAVRHFSLRDNAAAMVSSLFPMLDPMSGRVRRARKHSPLPSPLRTAADGMYLFLLCAAQPLALAEAALGRGGTLTVWATVEKNPR